MHPGVVKGWHKHGRMVLNYACPYGRIKLVLYDDREDSPTRGEVMELFLGPDDYQLVQIPTNVWNSFKGLGEVTSIIANCATEPHTKEFTETVDPLADSYIPYDWRIRPATDAGPPDRRQRIHRIARRRAAGDEGRRSDR